MSDKNLNFIVLAAGKGTRMKSDKPKVMHGIGGVPMIEVLLLEMLKISPKETALITSDQGLKLGQKFAKIKQIIQKERLGTGHAVKIALDNLNISGVAVILYGDTPFISGKLVTEINEKIKQGCSVCVAGFETDKENQYGRLVVGKDKNLEKIIEFKEASEAEKSIKLCNSGIIGFDIEKVKDLISKIDNNNSKKEYYLTDIVEIANKENLKVGFVVTDEKQVQGINNKSELAMANKDYFEAQRKRALDEAVTLQDPATTYIAHDTKFGSDVEIEPNVYIGAGVTIGDKVTIKAFSHIEGAEIGSGSMIGPFARIRPGTVIEGDAKIGNFVETKKSKIAKGAKINHLSYVGDSKIGKNVNIGAGTITCNYDGFEKFETVIEDGVFVGSNTALVAPITIGQDSIVGAGSTITRDIPKDSITIARSEQKDLKGAATKFRNSKKKN